MSQFVPSNLLEVVITNYVLPPRRNVRDGQQLRPYPSVHFENGTHWTLCTVTAIQTTDDSSQQYILPLLLPPSMLADPMIALLESQQPLKIRAKHFTGRLRDTRIDRESAFGGLLNRQSYLQVSSIESVTLDEATAETTSVEGTIAGVIHRVLQTDVRMQEEKCHRVIVRVGDGFASYLTVNIPVHLAQSEFVLKGGNRVTLGTTMLRTIRWLSKKSELLAGIDDPRNLQRLQELSTDHFVVTSVTPASDAVMPDQKDRDLLKEQASQRATRRRERQTATQTSA